MKNSFIGSLLHLSDPTLPIGGFSHSDGLETYVQLNIVHDVASAELFIVENLKSNIKYNDASFVQLAYKAASTSNLDEIISLDQECTALKSAKEIIHLFQDLCREDGISILMVTHDPLQASMADRMLLLKDGLTAASDIRSAWGIEEVN